MKVKDLLSQWEESAGESLTARQYSIRLPVRDAARLAALAEIYPRRNITQIITDLLSAGLDEIEEALPYERGERVIAEDEQGDPVFEDVGPTARFRDLTRKFSTDLRRESAPRDDAAG
jgi:predicted DNA-binding protein